MSKEFILQETSPYNELTDKKDFNKLVNKLTYYSIKKDNNNIKNLNLQAAKVREFNLLIIYTNKYMNALIGNRNKDERDKIKKEREEILQKLRDKIALTETKILKVNALNAKYEEILENIDRQMLKHTKPFTILDSKRRLTSFINKRKPLIAVKTPTSSTSPINPKSPIASRNPKSPIASRNSSVSRNPKSLSVSRNSSVF
jgi:hypothetical protein